MILKIDLSVWTTQKAKAKTLGITKQAVCNQIERGTLQSWHIPELHLTLVKK